MERGGACAFLVGMYLDGEERVHRIVCRDCLYVYTETHMNSIHRTFYRPSFITLFATGCVLTALYFTATIPVHAACTAESMVGAQYGASGAQVRALQQCLIDVGYSIPAGPTGYYGAQTRSAVQAFYAGTVSMPGWHGNSVGPVGRSALVRKAQGTGVAQSGRGYRTVRDATDLAKYVSAERSAGLGMRGSDAVLMAPVMEDAGSMNAESGAIKTSSADERAVRMSGTNVQVAGIDEPDIVKTDGSSIYISNIARHYSEGMPAVARDVSTPSIMPSYRDESGTQIVDALPPEDLAIMSESIKETGDMLLVKNKKILVVLSYPDIVAYNVADPKKPLKVWDYSLKDNTSVVTARLLDDTVYLVTSTYLQNTGPCPIAPMKRRGVDMVIPCNTIMVPERIEPVDNLYTVLAIDPLSGTTVRQTSFAAEAGNTTVSMFEDNLYVASHEYGTESRIMADIILEVMLPYVSESAKARARAIQGYDISDVGKLQEISKIVETELAQKTSDERLRIETEMGNKAQELLKARIRDMYRTRLMRISVDTLSVAATGDVPGYLLNQFALDEYEGNLRVAVTVDGGLGSAESVNDVYVLNNALSVVGSVKDLGKTERIYSVRFMGDVGYVVTFRQTDPFYVLDLSVPTAPKVAGELKIPGYSAYLEYLGDDRVLGVGREGGGVKLSIFDVSDPAKPTEKSKYVIKDSWSEVEGNHHAFLRDADNKVFFIPGSEGGYIFSYANGTLSLKHTVSGYGVRRALYLDDNFYVLSDSALKVYNMNTWKELKSLSL